MKRSTDPASLEWKENGTPYSTQFGDVYYSASGGRAESQYIFLDQNKIPEAWTDRADFTIGELGFGTGLNFFLTLKSWRDNHLPRARLNYFTFEKFLLPVEAFKKANEQWTDLSDSVQAVIDAYPPFLEGIYCLELEKFNARLLIGVGEALSRLKEVCGHFDAWYFDGFSPEKNPDLWSSDIFAEVSRLSRPGTTFSTFTSAGAVRRLLTSHGFKVEKIKGYGAKRESLKGVFSARKDDTRDSLPGKNAKLLIKSGRTTITDVAIVGAGLAGCAAAYALAKRGVRVTVLEKSARPASGASGHFAATYRPYLSTSFDSRSSFYASAFYFVSTHLRSVSAVSPEPIHSECGLIEIPVRERSQKLLRYMEENDLPPELVEKLSSTEASELSGIPISTEAIFYPRAGCLFPIALCDFYLSSSNVFSKLYNSPVFTITRKDDLWRVKVANGTTVAESSHVILANSFNCADINVADFLRSEPVRGQLSLFSATTYSLSLRTALSYGGYATPARKGTHVVGASYEHGSRNTAVDPESSASLLRKLEQASPLLAAEFKKQIPLKEVVAFRGSSFDRMPYIGPVPDPHSGELLEGLYISAGHGSRGMISCPFAAEILTSQICGGPAPIEKQLLDAVAPIRYLSRLKRS